MFRTLLYRRKRLQKWLVSLRIGCESLLEMTHFSCERELGLWAVVFHKQIFECSLLSAARLCRTLLASTRDFSILFSPVVSLASRADRVLSVSRRDLSQRDQLLFVAGDNYNRESGQNCCQRQRARHDLSGETDQRIFYTSHETHTYTPRDSFARANRIKRRTTCRLSEPSTRDYTSISRRGLFILFFTSDLR